MASEVNNKGGNIRGGTGQMGSGLYKPGCLVMSAPGLLVIGVLVLGVLGGWSMWIMIPVLVAIVAIAAMIHVINRPKINSPDTPDT